MLQTLQVVPSLSPSFAEQVVESSPLKYSFCVSLISGNMVLLFKASHDCIVEALLAIILKFWLFFYFADQNGTFPPAPAPAPQ